MQLKIASIMAGVLGTTVLATSAVAYQISQSLPTSNPATGTTISLPSLPENLALTSQQEEDIADINEDLRSQMEAILSSDQENLLYEALEAGEHMRSALMSLNLSSEQKGELRQAIQSAQSDIQDILTEEQKDYIYRRFDTRRSRFNRSSLDSRFLPQV